MEDIKKDDVIEEENEKVDSQEEKMVTVAEMQRRINKEKEEKEKLKKEYEEKMEKQIQDAIEKKEKERAMDADELAEYRLNEEKEKARQKEEELQAVINSYKEKERLAGIRQEASNKLNEYKISNNEKVLNLVVTSEIDKTIENIEALRELINEEKSKYVGSQPPVVGGGSNENRAYNNTYDLLRNLKKEN